MLRRWNGYHHRLDILPCQQLAVRRAKLHVILLRQRTGAIRIHIANGSERTKFEKIPNQILSPISTTDHTNSGQGTHVESPLFRKLDLTLFKRDLNYRKRKSWKRRAPDPGM